MEKSVVLLWEPKVTVLWVENMQESVSPIMQTHGCTEQPLRKNLQDTKDQF